MTSSSRRQMAIDSDDELRNVEFETSEGVEIVPTFKAMNLNTNLVRGIYSYGFAKPTAIQQRAIKQIVKGNDLIAQSPPYTGKTAAFSIGALQCLDTQTRDTQVLILAPTRELAVQIQKVVSALGGFMNVQCCACVGKTNVDTDVRKLDYGQHIVTGTPGRVFDMIRRRNLRTRGIKMLVLDEADEMLTNGSKQQLYDICRYLPPGVQVVMLSATLPRVVLEMTSKFMTDPVRILIKRNERTLDGIIQFFVAVGREERKFDALSDLCNMWASSQVVVFCNTRQKVHWLVEKMREANVTASSVNAKMKQKKRDEIMRQFRAGESRVLVSTDTLTHSLDAPQVDLVVNYDLPRNRELYIHRIGHLGPFGRFCIVVNFAKQDEIYILRDIEQYYSTQIDEIPMVPNDSV